MPKGAKKTHSESQPSAFSMNDPLASGLKSNNETTVSSKKKKDKRISLDIWSSPFGTAENPELKVEEEEEGPDSCIVVVAKLIVFVFSTVALAQGLLLFAMGLVTYGMLAETINVSSFFTDLIPVR